MRRVASRFKPTWLQEFHRVASIKKDTRVRFIHKRLESGVAAARAPKGKSSIAGAKPELPVSE